MAPPEATPRIITLTSDYGAESLYAAALKGAIIQQDARVRIVDITHDIRPFDTNAAAFALRATAPHFPRGTVHLIAMNTNQQDDYVHRVMELGGQFYVGLDDGIFSLIANRKARCHSRHQRSIRKVTFSHFPNVTCLSKSPVTWLKVVFPPSLEGPPPVGRKANGNGL